MPHDAPDTSDFKRVVFFTGAGLSAECGLPTYRGKGGLWGSYDWRESACQRAFERNPEKVWVFHDERRRLMGSVAPGPAHRIIAAVEREHPSTCVVTQNIDGLHQRAGSRNVTELHGSLWRVRCEGEPGLQENLEMPISSHVCPTCHAWRRPDIIWFEDPMDPEPVGRAIGSISDCDLLISIGTSGAVFPAADFPRFAVDAGATCIEINPEETPVSDWYGIHMRGGAGEMLARLWPQHAGP
jgi:NAD-dependent deacetylase